MDPSLRLDQAIGAVSEAVGQARQAGLERLGVVAAHAFGLAGESFLREDEALAWLREAG